jgi:hypothetical protein
MPQGLGDLEAMATLGLGKKRTPAFLMEEAEAVLPVTTDKTTSESSDLVSIWYLMGSLSDPFGAKSVHKSVSVHLSQ